MEYFAGLDVSMEETHICVLDREGEAVHEAKVVSTPAAIADGLTKAPACRCVVFVNAVATGCRGTGLLLYRWRFSLPDLAISSFQPAAAGFAASGTALGGFLTRNSIA